MAQSSRNIVLFSDGTGNSSGKLFRTNVWRTYQALDLADPQCPEDPRQFAYYDDGVGTSSFKPYAILGGAIGVGLARNVRDLYAFLCRTYRPGDRIYAFGFSRGAFTIRVLVGLIASEGIAPYDGREAELDRLVAAAYRNYRKSYGTRLGAVTPFRKLRDGVIAFFDRLRGRETYGQARSRSRPAPEIAYVGLWDTVDAYGLPIDELTRAIDKVFWPLSIPTRRLSDKVRLARHALGLDDERNTFHPKLWTEDPTDTAETVEVRARDPADPTRWVTARRPRIDQVWFAGVHSNVGGGYADDALSYVPLLWIMQGAEEAGLRILPEVMASYAALSDENGLIYDSRKGLASYYRYNPRRIANIIGKEGVTLQAVRIHESALRRIATGEDGYAPIVLPPEFQVVQIDGRRVDGAAYLGIAGRILPSETEHVWNHVWKRRVAYFVTFFASLTLLAAPLRVETATLEGACRSPVCFVEPAIRMVAPFVPSFASAWLDAFTSSPGRFLVLAGIVAGGLWAGTRFALEVTDGMRAAWYGLEKTRPPGLKPAIPVTPFRHDGWIQRLRLSGRYQDFMRWLTRTAIPAVFVVALLLAGWAVASQVSLAILESTGATCSRRDVSVGTFSTTAFCTAPIGEVREGSRYHIAVTVHDAWADGSPLEWLTPRAAGPNGIAPTDTTLLTSLGVPWRRYLGQPWLKLMLRIGAKGSDTYAPEWRRMSPIPSDGKTFGEALYVTEFTARTAGRLYVYVNDAVAFPLPRETFYRPNLGTASVAITVASESR